MRQSRAPYGHTPRDLPRTARPSHRQTIFTWQTPHVIEVNVRLAEKLNRRQLLSTFKRFGTPTTHTTVNVFHNLATRHIKGLIAPATHKLDNFI
jgi:hypothetical protein